MWESYLEKKMAARKTTEVRVVREQVMRIRQ